MGITGTQLPNMHPTMTTGNNPQDYLRPSRLELYLDPDQRLQVPKTRFVNPQHPNLSTNNDLDSSIKPSPPNKRLAYGENFTHFPNI